MRPAASMRAYYERRAPEYDDWYTGAGLFAARERPGHDLVIHSLLVERLLDTPAGMRTELEPQP